MITSNLGKIERSLRLLIAAAVFAWVIGGDNFGIAQGIALLAAFALLWNSIFARCYLWKWLGLNTRCRTQCSAAKSKSSETAKGPAGSSGRSRESSA